jgi:hypothetical protein
MGLPVPLRILCRLTSGNRQLWPSAAPKLSAADDLVVLARGLSARVPMTPADRPFVLIPSGSDWMIAIISHSALTGPVGQEMPDSSLYVAPPHLARRPVGLHVAAGGLPGRWSDRRRRAR